MIKLVWRTDVHLSDKAPASRKDDWTETVFNKLVQTKIVAEKLGAQGVLDGGDFFHVKSPGRNSHSLIRRVAELHKSFPCPVYCTPGNHDCVYGDYTYLHQQPLGVLYAAGVFKPLYDEHEAVFIDPASGVKVRVVGVPYHGTQYEMSRFFNITKGDEDYLVVVAHVLASVKGGTMFEGEDIISYHDLMGVPADAFCFLPGTQVQDWNGRSIPIEEIQDSHSLSGRSGPVVVEQKHPPREVDEEVVVLDVEGVPGTLIPGVTLEHPFWVASGLHCRLPSRRARRCHPEKVYTSYPCSYCSQPPVAQPEWKPAGEIEAGDYVAIPVPHCSDEIHEPALARLLGLYLAEGHIKCNRAKEPCAGVGWTFHEDEIRLHEDVGTIVKRYFGLETKSRGQPGSKAFHVSAYGAEISAFFLEHGGRYSHQKQMSPWVWRLTPASRLEILVGWLDGDGHARNPERYDRVKVAVMGATVSPQMASQMFLLALSLGLRPFYTTRPPGEHFFGEDASPSREVHILSFYGEDAQMLGSRMGVVFPERYKTKVSGFFHDGLFWRRVRGVQRQRYQGLVYNMRTSTQEYMAGMLLTHNCFGHWHKDQGAVEMGGKWFVNTGSLTRGSIAQDDLIRQPACAVLSFTKEKMGIQVVRLRVQPSGDVFDVEGKERAKERATKMDTFVENIRGTLAAVAGRDLKVAVGEMEGVPDAVRERTILYLERADD